MLATCVRAYSTSEFAYAPLQVAGAWHRRTAVPLRKVEAMFHRR